MQPVLETLEDRPLVFEGVSPSKVQLEGAHADDHERESAAGSAGGRFEGARNLFGAIALDHVTHFEVVEVLDRDTALEALAHFAHVLLEATQRRNRAVVHFDAIANEPYPTLTVDHAASHPTPGDGANS